MTTFKRTVAENMAGLKAWHNKKHHAQTWDQCPHEPCRELDTEFREAWQ